VSPATNRYLFGAVFSTIRKVEGHPAKIVKASSSGRRSIVVRTSVLAGGLSLSCARLMDGCLTTLWVKRPLSVNQQGQLSLPSLRGRLNE